MRLYCEYEQNVIKISIATKLSYLSINGGDHADQGYDLYAIIMNDKSTEKNNTLEKKSKNLDILWTFSFIVKSATTSAVLFSKAAKAMGSASISSL